MIYIISRTINKVQGVNMWKDGICISATMQGKMKGMASINVSPLDNPFCMNAEKYFDNGKDIVVCQFCYSKEALNTFRVTARSAWKKNGDLFSTAPLKVIPKLNFAYVRFNAHGEIINTTHYENYLRIVKHNPDTMFVLWSKRNDIVAPEKLSNLIHIYSNPYINKYMEKPKGWDKIFSVYTKPMDNVTINCSGKCMECLKCYKHNKIKYVNEVIRLRQKKDRVLIEQLVS